MWTKAIKYTKFIILLVALFVSYYAMDRVLSFKTAHGICQARDMYAQPRDTVDVVFLGSSHIHCDVNTTGLLPMITALPSSLFGLHITIFRKSVSISSQGLWFWIYTDLQDSKMIINITGLVRTLMDSGFP